MTSECCSVDAGMFVDDEVGDVDGRGGCLSKCLAALRVKLCCCCMTLDVMLFLFKSVATCNKPFVVVLPSVVIGADPFGGCVNSVIMSDIDYRIKSSIFISGIGIVCGIKTTVSLSSSLLV